MIMLKWENIDDWTQRAKVFGGWLVRTNEPVVHNLMNEGRGMEDGWDYRISMCFVPDPNYEWIITREEQQND